MSFDSIELMASKLLYGYNEINNNYNGGDTYYNSVLNKDGIPKKGKDCNNQYYQIIGFLLEYLE